MILRKILISSLLLLIGCSSHNTLCNGVLLNEKCASKEFISGKIIHKFKKNDNSYEYIILDDSGKSILYKKDKEYEINQRINIRYELNSQ